MASSLLTCVGGLLAHVVLPKCFEAGAGAFCVSCCDCTLLFARAHRLTHTEYAYTLLTFQHGECVIYHRANAVTGLFFLFLLISWQDLSMRSSLSDCGA